MKSFLTIIFLFTVSISFAQKVDSLKLTPEQSKKIEAIQESIKKQEPVRTEIQVTDMLYNQLIEAPFDGKSIPVPTRKEYKNGYIYYIKDEAKK